MIFKGYITVKIDTADHDCAENIALNRPYNAVSHYDQDAVRDAVEACLRVLWPFLRSQCDSKPRNVIILQSSTMDGALRVRSHDLHLEYPLIKAIDNTFPDVPTYKPSDVNRMEEIIMHIFTKWNRRFDLLHEIHLSYRSGGPRRILSAK